MEDCGAKMNQDIETESLPPSADRLALGMREMGYTFKGAIADLVDNSISAGAQDVDIFIEAIFGGYIRVGVVDNGHGLNMEQIRDAMKYGSEAKHDPDSLSKFGLGLKTASSAFSKRFSMISRVANSKDVYHATWDIDEIVKRNDWILAKGRASSDQIEILDRFTKENGTLILWENIDKLIPEKIRHKANEVKKLIKIHESDLMEHLSLVFQRFLNPAKFPEISQKINLRVNGKEVEAFDPFCEDEVDTTLIIDKPYELVLPSGKTGIITIRGFVIPRRERFSTPEAESQARIGNQNQGLFIYRKNRLITGPDWQGIYKTEPHYSLARIDISFSPNLDEILKVGVRKSDITLDQDIKEFLSTEILPLVRNYASTRYREGQRINPVDPNSSIHKGSNKAVGNLEKDLGDVKIVSTDVQKNTATIENRFGTSTVRLLKPTEQHKDEPFITTSDNLLDGVFWEPVIHENRRAVAINSTHPFYDRVYLPSKQTEVVIQSFDRLIWALALGEMSTTNERVKDFYEQLRIDVSRYLRKLSDTLPESESYDA